MALTNTINFLPAVFRSPTNQRFLGATMDQLTTDAINIPLNGYIGRTFAPTYKLGDNYVPELSAVRKNYQLEPSVVVSDDSNNIEFNTGYIDLLNSIKSYGGLVDNQQRLFSSESYSYNGHFDYDKFVNYYNYYWLPNGPATVAVYSNQAPYQADYTVTRNTAVGGYVFSDTGYQPNTQLTLVRGGTYTFNVDQAGSKFWIQSSPGTAGVDANISTVNTREVYGVSNNGAESGIVRFSVPLRSAQDFYIQMPIADSVDAAVTFEYSDIQNKLLSEFLVEFPVGIDGINNQLQNKSLVFINNNKSDLVWTTPPVTAPYSDLDIATIRPGDVISDATRTGTWKIDLVSVDALDSDFIIQISPQTAVTARQKVFITSGKTYASNQFWLNDTLDYVSVPLITANRDRLYYQDSNNPGFVGEIKLIDNISTPIDIDQDIIGKVGYTSPNGVVFTNGLRVAVDRLVNPVSYFGQEFTVYTEWADAVVIAGGTVVDDNLAYLNDVVIGDWSPALTTGYIYDNEYYVEGVGTSIKLVPVSRTIIPEDFAVAITTQADYITINRSSQDRNAWSRSNRWFHKDIITLTATYNNTVADYGPNLPGRRPIIEFDADLQLFNYGIQAKNSVDLVTFTDTDAFGLTVGGTRVEGQESAIVDGVTLVAGMRVIFAQDYDFAVRNQIWEVTFIEDLGASNFYINLIPTADNIVHAGQNVLVTDGDDNASNTYRFDGSDWFVCQPKTALNQTPLFDLADSAGYSFGDATVYPDSDFAGNKIFSYLPGTGNNDTVLGFPLKYQNFNNIGDIVFNNYYNTESFGYTTNTTTGATDIVNCSTGYVIKTSGLESKTYLNSWVKTVEPTSQYQLFTKFFDGRVLSIDGTNRAFVQLDILPTASASIPHLKVYKNNTLMVAGTDYELSKYGEYDIIVFLSLPAVGDKIDVAVFSNDVSKLAFYEVPDNLDRNPLNEYFSTIALGQIRTHYNQLLENTSASSRPVQDSYLTAQGGTLSQHSAPLVYAMTFLNDPVVNFVNGIELAKKEYTRFKNKFISLCSTLTTLDYNDPISGVDEILQTINSVKNNSFPWYYSDMVPQGGNYTTINYTVLNVRQTNYEIGSIFNTSELSNRAVLIWHNNEQLIHGLDYTFSPNVPAVIFTKEFTVGDTITVRDYFDTDGNFIPETPTKLGLYPKSEPVIVLDTTYQTPTNVIRGHDGSLTPVFNDFRDDYLLELEKRIYNNIKADYTKNIINLYDVIPGRFRTTEYTQQEFTQVLASNFLQWAGANNVDYTTNQWYDANNSWTWNYSRFTDTVDNQPLQGSWRAIYQYWYDTDQPNLSPWQMLGFGFKPSWWETRYGVAPYTSGNFTLWEDLEAGYVWNNGDAYVNPRFVRPGLTSFIPVDTAGNLLPPTDINLVKQASSSVASDNFSVGQQGPVETAWRRSSDYPFAVQLTLALLKPATYFGTQFDTSAFFVNTVSEQFTNTTNQTISPARLSINGDTTTGTVIRTSGYVNWIADVIKNVGIDPVEKIAGYLKNLTVKLNYKIGGFTDKNIITVTAEQTAPGTTRGGVYIPDNNYAVYLNKSVPVATATYSAVIVQRTQAGYSVVGYNTNNPFFTILPSVANANAETVVVDDATVKLYQDYSASVVNVPYGTTYSSIQQLSDFLISYERYLESVGFVFEQFDADLQEVRNFKTSVKEFLFWSQQGWEIGTVIVLNPAANRVTLKTAGVVVDEVGNTATTGRVTDQNFLPIKSTNFNILRTESVNAGNLFRLTTLNGTNICFANLKLIQFEHVLVFDNESDFGDIIYVPSQGLRQYRLKLAGTKTGAWTGALSAAGYVYSDATVNDWQTGVDYQVGDIVNFNNSYYTALNSIPASTKFNITDWAQINKSDLNVGLLPNFGQQAQQLESIYNIDRPPSDENLQLFSAGLIGFRPRSYLTDLGISIANQTKFYQGFIKEKGSLNSISALTKADFNNVTGAIDIFEEWGFKVGQYGDLDGNQYKEFILDQSVFNTNPVAFTLGNTYSTGNIIVNLKVDANLSLSNVYNSSNLSNTSSSLYSNRPDVSYTTDLPTAGYVHVDDADLTIFDINTYHESPAVTVGSRIWVAKDINNSWNVYRVSETAILATELTYVLDDFAQMTFDGVHPFVVGDLFAVQGFDVSYFDNAVLENFNTNYDSVYQVIDVIDTTTVVIQITNVDALNNLIATSPVISSATVYKLVSSVIETIADVGDIEPLDGWLDGDKVWVNNATAEFGWGVYTFNDPSWVLTRSETPQVDTTTVNRTFIYNRTNNNIIAAIDVVDPSKGKILASVANDIDYRVDHDPATYNVGTGTVNIRTDYHWGPQQVGRIWWNLNDVRYINYEQDALIYRLNHWGDTFPGSEITIYEWVESSVLPSEFGTAGQTGTPLYADDSAYSTYGYVDQSGAVKVKYYFWVTNRAEANTTAGKQNSTIAITSAIENPQNQDVPYANILRDDTIALYNVKNLLIGQNSVLHISTQNVDAGLIHAEYALVQEKSANSELPSNIVNKLIDSLAKIDQEGNTVPDPALPVSQRYGIDIRPRQTMFIDIASALLNLGTLVNQKLYAYPVTQRKVLTLLNSEELAPGVRAEQYDLVVESLTVRSYINTDLISSGYRVLVSNDASNLGKWAIYEWSGSAWALAIRDDSTEWVQRYKTNLYWSYADWYDASFDPTTTINITVADNLEFGKLTLTADTYIKVLNAGNDKFAIYYINSALERVTVGLESGTILLPTSLTDVPGKELRQILLSLQNEIFIDDLAQDFNEIFFAMVKFALTEQKNLDWVFKTSFISATQYIRKLEKLPNYIADNQDYYQSYIDEVKPYRTILREFNINYQRNDEFGGDITDFDLPPYWDSNINVYRSPSGEQSYDSELLNNQVYRDWKNNYAYGVVDVVVGAGGTGFVTAPEVVISGGGGSGATATASIDAFGILSNITILTPGSGYTSSPAILINGTGSGAIATAVLRNVFDTNTANAHNVIRSISTNIKFDRVTYDIKRPAEWANTIPTTSGLTNSNAFVMWDEVEASQVLAPFTIINIDDILWQVTEFAHTINANIDFPIANVVSISSANLQTANDRIVAYHGNIDLSATATGLDYPGVIVDGSNYFAYDTITTWTANTSIVLGTQIAYNGNVYIVNGNVAAPTFDAILSNVTQVSAEKIDSIIQSRFTDSLGVSVGDIIVDGGDYVDIYSSHAPEELVPGRVYDSADIRVFGNVAPDTNDYAFRLLTNLNDERGFYRISDAATTALTTDLSITDDKIFVEDALKLPIPNRELGIPGIVFINGEKISYYRNYAQEILTPWASNTVIDIDTITSFDGEIYLTTGNVFAVNIPWTANTVFATDTYFYYSGNSYQATGNINAPLFSDIVANTALLYNNEDSGFATIISNTTLIGDTVNVLSQIRRAVDGTAPNGLNVTPWTVNTVTPVGLYVSYTGNTYVTTGNTYGYDDIWRANVVFATNSFFSYGGNVYQSTGNVYAPAGGSFSNIAGNTALIYTNRVDSGFASIEANISLLYSGVDNLRHLANTRVVDASRQQAIPDFVVSNVEIVATTPFNVTSNVSVKLRVSSNITANIGDYITTSTANVRVLETATASSNIAVTGINGNIFTTTGNAVSVVDHTTSNVTVTTANVVYANVLGTVSGVGNVTVAANTFVIQDAIWYGNVTALYYGDTLGNSTTPEAEFLKAEPGYIP